MIDLINLALKLDLLRRECLGDELHWAWDFLAEIDCGYRLPLFLNSWDHWLSNDSVTLPDGAHLLVFKVF